MELTTILDKIARYATLLTVLVGVISATLTIRQWHRAHSFSAATELVKAIQTPEFTRAIILILELPEDAAPERVLADRETTTAAYIVSHVFESLGVMVFYRVIPLHLVDHLIGGYVRASWRRLEAHAYERRRTLGASFGEWFQWLFERMEESPAPGTIRGAAEEYRWWRR